MEKIKYKGNIYKRVDDGLSEEQSRLDILHLAGSDSSILANTAVRIRNLIERGKAAKGKKFSASYVTVISELRALGAHIESLERYFKKLKDLDKK